MMSEASVGGKSASLQTAIEAAATILRDSRCPVIAGLATDYAGAEAAVDLARKLGGSVDHCHASAALRDLDVMRRAGWIVTTPLQARARADLIVVVGDADAGSWVNDGTRRVLRLGADDIGIVRALIGKRPVRTDSETLRAHATALAEAKYGVAVWDAAALDDLAIEMVSGLLDDLNATTRFAGLPLDAGMNATGVAAAMAQRCGFPMRTGFARGFAEHDPWRFDVERMIACNEADAAVWIAAIEPMAPPRLAPARTIALTGGDVGFATPPEVSITVGQPGRDHDAALFRPELGAIGFVGATAPSARPPVADVLAQIAMRVGC